MIVYLTQQQISDLKDILVRQRQLPQITPRYREKLYLLYEALDKAKPTEQRQYEYKHVIAGPDMTPEINYYVERGWEVISHAALSNHNKSILFRKEKDND